MANPLNNTAPPITDFQDVWNIFDFAIGTGTGFVVVTGLIILAVVEFYVFVKKGPKAAMTFLFLALPLLVNMGFFPTWVRIVTYISATIVGINWYVRSTEGV